MSELTDVGGLSAAILSSRLLVNLTQGVVIVPTFFPLLGYANTPLIFELFQRFTIEFTNNNRFEVLALNLNVNRIDDSFENLCEHLNRIIKQTCTDHWHV